MVSTVYSEGFTPGHFILAEEEPYVGRENIVVTLAAGQKLEAGHVLARLAATGKYVPYDNTGTDGTEGAAAILYATIDNTAGEAALDVEVAAVVRDTAVRRDGLQWAAGVDAAGKTAAYADLAAAHVIVRD